MKTTKEAIRDIINDIQCPDCTYPRIDGAVEIEKAVNRIDLLISTIKRQTRLERTK
jgi:hypothetical protein